MATIDREIIWNGRDNTIDFVLYADQDSGCTIQNLSSVTHVAVTFGSGTTISSATSPELFPGGVTSSVGELNLQFGNANLAPGAYKSELIVFDATNSNGLVWGGKIPIIVKG